MSVAFVVPGLSPPPPEPPPRDYSPLESHHPVPEEKRDDKIRARMEACKQGMLQLDALRSKHQRLMQQMRGRLPPIPGCAAVVQARIKKSSEPQDRCSLQSVDSAISTNTMSTPSRSSSPSISHRSSVSCDSGCSSVYSIDTNGNQPTIPYSTYRKLSVEERGLPANRQSKDIHQSPLDPAARSPLPIVVTTIASTTSLEGAERHWRRKHGAPRPRSMYEKGTEKEYGKDSILDSASFSQITPPPIHRKMGIAQSPPILQVSQPSSPKGQAPHSPLMPVRFAVNASPQSPQRPLRTAQKPVDLVVKAKAVRVQSPEAVFHASCIFVDRSPPSDRRRTTTAVRPRSLFASSEEEPLYATPARVLVRDRTVPSFAQSTSRKTAFSPVVSRIVSTYAGISEKAARGSGKMLGKEWRESEGL